MPERQARLSVKAKKALQGRSPPGVGSGGPTNKDREVNEAQWSERTILLGE